MKAIVCKEFGPPEKLVLEEVADPKPGAGELVIDVRASTVTFPDALMIEDKYQFKATLPFVPGGEVAGVVCELGEGVSRFEVGDRVVGSTMLVGGFAEKVLVKESGTKKLSENLGFAESTGILYAYGTGRKEASNFIPAERLAQLPTAPGNIKYASTYDDEFWVENKEALEKRFKVWLTK